MTREGALTSPAHPGAIAHTLHVHVSVSRLTHTQFKRTQSLSPKVTGNTPRAYHHQEPLPLRCTSYLSTAGLRLTVSKGPPPGNRREHGPGRTPVHPALRLRQAPPLPGTHLPVLCELREQVHQGVQVPRVLRFQFIIFLQKVLRSTRKFCYFNLKSIFGVI